MIYIIDDDQYVRRSFEILFKSAGLECNSFGSALEFLNAAHLIENDIIILDIHMPGMDGCELLQYLSTLELYLPVIVITAYDEAASRECAKKYGALAYLRKPVDSEALIDLIKYSTQSVE
jgi:FixJ family two-component response regulator